jgi:hypothetical protein
MKINIYTLSICSCTEQDIGYHEVFCGLTQYVLVSSGLLHEIVRLEILAFLV